MSKKLKQVKIDFSVTTHESVNQAKATKLIIMTVLTMILTRFCPTVTIIEVHLQVQVFDHLLGAWRMHHQCPEKQSSKMDIFATKVDSISKKYFHPGGMAPSEGMRAVRAVRDTLVTDDCATGVNSTCRVPHHPLIAV
jgi:hypothetical protein